MLWCNLLDGVATLAVDGTLAADIQSVQYDSRLVKQGALFVAMRGETTDGNKYVRNAIDAGAIAIVTDSRESYALANARHVPAALVKSGRRALAEVSANFYGHPEKALALTAVTGTNGKTTTAFLTESLLRSAGRTSVLLGTIETHVGGKVRPSLHTTPESRDVLQVFADGVAADATEAVMEMSSHALEQERVWGLPVDTAVFTNLTQDHLDYHVTMENYGAAKARLFAGVGAPPPRVAILNADDAATPMMARAASECAVVWRFGIDNKEADFHASAVRLAVDGMHFKLRTPSGSAEIASRLTGRVNVYNLLSAIAAATARGLSLDQIVRGTAELSAVPGRFQAVPNALGLAVIVDYAHTDDALRKLIVLARELAGGARVITVFGCGGDRDRTKRPKMGRAAGEGSNIVIVTNDNPRSEIPSVIAEETLAGVRQAGTCDVFVELDRATAIASAVHEARAGDVVLIAGKGHEKTQTGRDGPVPFDDVAVAAKALRTEELRR